MQTMKVKPWSEDQGDHVLINAEDFDLSKHERLDDEAQEISGDGSGEALPPLSDQPQDAPATGARRGRKPKAE